MTQLKIWIAIVDGEHARFVAHDTGYFRTVRTLTSPIAHQRTSSLMSDRLGRSFESANIKWHAIAPRNNLHARAKRRFAAQVAAELNAAATQGLFSRLILVAPSRTLPAIEEALDPHVCRRIAGRVAKSLIKSPDSDLAAHFPAWPFVGNALGQQ